MGTIAQANASVILVKQETTWGTQATGNYGTLRVTNARFGQRTGTVTSNIINPTREPGDVIRVDLGAEGSFDFEMDLRYGTVGTNSMGPLNLFPSLFGGNISSALAISSALDVTTVVAGDTCKWIGTGSDFANVRVGDWLLATGFVNAANDGWYYVSAKTSNTDITVKNPAAVAETTATTVTVEGFRFVFGSTLTGFTIEQKIPTVEPLYHKYLGMVMGSTTLNIAPGSLITGTMSWLGKNGAQSTGTVSGGPVAAATSQLLNSIDHVTAVYEGRQGLAETWKVANLSLNIANDFAPRNAVANLGAVGIRMGRANVTGSMRLYVEHGVSETGGIKDIMDSYLAGTSRSESATMPGALGIVLTDAGSPAIRSTIMLHKYFITNANVAVGGNNEDLFLDVEFAAQVNPLVGEGTTGAITSPRSFSVHLSA